MDSLEPTSAWVIVPIVAAFAVNMFAEWLLLYSERRSIVALAKSAKATIVPALIALYALIIANLIVGSNS